MAVALYRKLINETSPEFIETFEKNLETITEMFKTLQSNSSIDIKDCLKLAHHDPPPITEYLEHFANDTIANKIVSCSDFEVTNRIDINVMGDHDYKININFTNNSHNFSLLFYKKYDGMGSIDDGVVIDYLSNNSEDILTLDENLIAYLDKIRVSLDLSCSTFEIYKALWHICIYGTPINSEISDYFQEWRYKYF